jgi:isocitrate dehydrogenase
MKVTEGAFRDWGYALAKEKFAERTVTETEVTKGASATGKLLIKDRIADAMFQQLVLRPDEYSVIAAPNLNGDYLSDAAAAQVGGLGLAPGGNVGDGFAMYEATHGTAPKYAGLDKVNPGSVLLSGAMMFEELGWDAVATGITTALSRAIRTHHVTYDLARQMPDAVEVSTSAFADVIIEHLP